MSTHKYLDETGLAQVWGKIKNLIPNDEEFVINFEYDEDETNETGYNLIADKTADEIRIAYESGKNCIGHFVYEDYSIDVEATIDGVTYTKSGNEYTYYSISFLSDECFIYYNRYSTSSYKYRYFQLSNYATTLTTQDITSGFITDVTINDRFFYKPTSWSELTTLLDHPKIKFEINDFSNFIHYFGYGSDMDGEILLQTSDQENYLYITMKVGATNYNACIGSLVVPVGNYWDENLERYVDGVYSTYPATANDVNTICSATSNTLRVGYYTPLDTYVYTTLAVEKHYSLNAGDFLVMSFVDPYSKEVIHLVSRGADSNLWDKVEASSGPTTLVDLTDTSISSPSNGQILMYNSTTSKWENTTLPIYNGGVSS